MIKRYSTPDMAEIWSDQNKYQKWLDVEIAAVSYTHLRAHETV